MIDYKALAGRLEGLAAGQDHLADCAFSVEGATVYRRNAADLRTVVSLLEGMAGMEPAARIYTDAELVHRDPRWGRVCWIVPECEIDGGALLYLHPAPQPIQQEPVAWSDGLGSFLTAAEKSAGGDDPDAQGYSVPLFTHPAPQPTAIPAPFMHLLGHAYGLSLGTDWNRGTHAEHYRRPLLDAVAECKRWLGSAPQPQPERQPVSEPTDAQIDIRWLRNVANEGRGAAMTDALHQAIDEIERLRAALAARESK